MVLPFMVVMKGKAIKYFGDIALHDGDEEEND